MRWEAGANRQPIPPWAARHTAATDPNGYYERKESAPRLATRRGAAESRRSHFPFRNEGATPAIAGRSPRRPGTHAFLCMFPTLAGYRVRRTGGNVGERPCVQKPMIRKMRLPLESPAPVGRGTLTYTHLVLYLLLKNLVRLLRAADTPPLWRYAGRFQY